MGLNAWLSQAGLLAWKPLLGSLLLPPVVFLLLALLGAMLRVARWPRAGALLLVVSVAGLWLTSTPAVGVWLVDTLTQPPPALTAAQRTALAGAPHTAILVLGGGSKELAPEYGTPDLGPLTLQRLRYALWLGRQTGLPVAYSGGVAHGMGSGTNEAEVADLVVRRDFGQRLRWLEDRSRDTDENALYSVALLRGQGIERIVLVTHDFHQRRALAAFDRAIRAAGASMTVQPAPVGVRVPGPYNLGDWMPSADGLLRNYLALHEWLGRLAGA